MIPFLKMPMKGKLIAASGITLHWFLVYILASGFFEVFLPMASQEKKLSTTKLFLLKYTFVFFLMLAIIAYLMA